MDKIKIFALYLPQFHTIPESDEWWGKGFTEWTNVKKAKPLFKGHNQPRVPLNDNYYNLLDDNTFKWQIDLAKKYGIDGFCFYHYWFNGKLLLEKPLENYLADKDLDFPYFFSWANEPWARTWDGQNTNVLMPQIYGGETDIINHFNYMLPFFKDSRYIKRDNKPLFVLYKSSSICYLEKFIEIWNTMSIKNGFDGVFFIETLNLTNPSKISPNTNGSFYFEPSWIHGRFDNIFERVLKRLHIIPPNILPYQKIWKRIIKKEQISETQYAGCFLDWDNSPRKGNCGLIYKGTSTNIFDYYFREQLKKMRKQKCPYIFINAWNEWCEGTYLEPDTKNRYSFLQAISEAKKSLILYDETLGHHSNI